VVWAVVGRRLRVTKASVLITSPITVELLLLTLLLYFALL